MKGSPKHSFQFVEMLDDITGKAFSIPRVESIVDHSVHVYGQLVLDKEIRKLVPEFAIEFCWVMAQNNDTPLCGEHIPYSKSVICETTTDHSTAFPVYFNRKLFKHSDSFVLATKIKCCDFLPYPERQTAILNHVPAWVSHSGYDLS